MANEKKSYYLVKVEGEYYKKVSSGGRDIGTFEAEFKVPFETENILHTVKRILVDPWLRKNKEGSQGHRTCTVVDVRKVVNGEEEKAPEGMNGEEKPIDRMSLSELREYCVFKGLSVDLVNAGSVVDARQMVKDELDNVELLKAQENDKKKKDAKRRKRESELKELNEDGNSGKEVEAAGRNRPLTGGRVASAVV